MSNSSNKNRSCAIIPFFNELTTLQKLVNEVKSYVDFIICVNDGSTDGSEKSISYSNDIELVTNQKNMGKGYSLRAGFITGLEMGFGSFITIDADLQHDPIFIPKFLKTLDNYKIVIGNRLNHLKSMPLHRILSNRITSQMLSIRFKQDILDSQCGYRAFNADIVKAILPETNGFEAETEMIIKALRNQIDIGFIPISTIYGDEKSKMKNMEAISGFLKVYFTK